MKTKIIFGDVKLQSTVLLKQKCTLHVPAYVFRKVNPGAYSFTAV